MRRELTRLHRIRIEGDAGSALACTELRAETRRILDALTITPPPPVTALEPA